ncbi:MAG: hypothetical protein NC184_05835 [Roseburia sp.]|nr:hypothetical protein [Roseburia sp.]
MAKKAGCGGDFGGLCCRMVIETKRVFDGCRFTDENITLTLTAEQPLPSDAVFVSARVVSSELVNHVISDGSGGCCNVYGEIVTRFAVTYSSGDELFTVAATNRENKTVMLNLPENGSLVPYSIEVSTVFNVGSGAIVGTNAVSITGCMLQIIKVTAPVDVLIPTYGYCKYPPCTGSVCPGISSQVIFPTFSSDDF